MDLSFQSSRYEIEMVYCKKKTKLKMQQIKQLIKEPNLFNEKFIRIPDEKNKSTSFDGKKISGLYSTGNDIL